jgi:hypothetical protein
MNINAHKPNTLEEAMECFKKLLSAEEQIDFARMSEDDIGRMHHGFGQWLRNNWGLWDETSAMCQHMHSLMREFWARMNRVPSTLAKEIEEYQEYWENI